MDLSATRSSELWLEPQCPWNRFLHILAFIANNIALDEFPAFANWQPFPRTVTKESIFCRIL